MNSSISTRVLDAGRGEPARGVRVEALPTEHAALHAGNQPGGALLTPTIITISRSWSLRTHARFTAEADGRRFDRTSHMVASLKAGVRVGARGREDPRYRPPHG